jgi:hypothetical protein
VEKRTLPSEEAARIADATTEERLRLLRIGLAPLASLVRVAEEDPTGPLVDGSALAAVAWVGLLRGETWFVDATVTAWVTDLVAATTHDRILPEEVPGSWGFIMLERPIMALDRWGNRLSYRAMAWGRLAASGADGEERPGLAMAHLGHGEDVDDFTDDNRALIEENPDLAPLLAGLHWSTIDLIDLSESWEVEHFGHASFLAGVWRLVRDHPELSRVAVPSEPLRRAAGLLDAEANEVVIVADP